MKKLSAMFAIVLVTVAATSSVVAAAGGTANTGTFGPAEEPTWIAPVLAAAVLILAIGVFVSSRRWKDHDKV